MLLKLTVHRLGNSPPSVPGLECISHLRTIHGLTATNALFCDTDIGIACLCGSL